MLCYFILFYFIVFALALAFAFALALALAFAFAFAFVFACCVFSLMLCSTFLKSVWMESATDATHSTQSHLHTL
jgi:hypothetical protein